MDFFNFTDGNGDNADASLINLMNTIFGGSGFANGTTTRNRIGNTLASSANFSGGNQTFGAISSLLNTVQSMQSSLTDNQIMNNVHHSIRNGLFICLAYKKEILFNYKFMQAKLGDKLDLEQEIEDLKDEIEDENKFDTMEPWNPDDLRRTLDIIKSCYIESFRLFKESSFLPNLKKLHKFLTDAFYYLQYVVKRQDQKQILQSQLSQKTQELNEAIDSGNEAGTQLFIEELSEIRAKLDEVQDANLEQVHADCEFLKSVDRKIENDCSNLFTEEELDRAFQLIFDTYQRIVEPNRERLTRQIREDVSWRNLLREYREDNDRIQNSENYIARADEISQSHGQTMRQLINSAGVDGRVDFSRLQDVEVPLDDGVLEKVGVEKFADVIEKDRSKKDDVCGICLENFKGEDNVRYFKCCKCVAHKDCIDEWFKSKHNCFMCRKDLRELYKQ
jgi:hypothetical protein